MKGAYRFLLVMFRDVSREANREESDVAKSKRRNSEEENTRSPRREGEERESLSSRGFAETHGDRIRSRVTTPDGILCLYALSIMSAGIGSPVADIRERHPQRPFGKLFRSVTL